MIEIPSSDKFVQVADRRERPGVALACMVVLCIALLGLLVVRVASAIGESSRNDVQAAESPLSP